MPAREGSSIDIISHHPSCTDSLGVSDRCAGCRRRMWRFSSDAPSASISGIPQKVKTAIGLLDRQIGRFRAAEYLGDHSGALTKNVNEAGTIAEQASLFGHFGPLI